MALDSWFVVIDVGLSRIGVNPVDFGPNGVTNLHDAGKLVLFWSHLHKNLHCNMYKPLDSKCMLFVCFVDEKMALTLSDLKLQSIHYLKNQVLSH